MQDLAAGATVDARLAARVAAIDPSASGIQKAAIALASAASDASRQQAVEAAMSAVTAHALGVLNRSTSVDLRVGSLSGHLANELSRPKP
jgi:hypothetical protein